MWKILLVEDSLDVAERVAEALGDDFDVTTVRTAREGGARARETHFDLVMLDVALPDGDGFALCRAIQQDAADTVIVFLATRSDTEDRMQEYATNCDSRKIASRLKSTQSNAGQQLTNATSVDPVASPNDKVSRATVIKLTTS